MSAEIIKAGGKRETGLVPVSDARRVMNQALAALRGNTEVSRPLKQPPRPEIQSPRRGVPTRIEVANGEIADLPRFCAVHDEPYVARYLRDKSGRYRFAQTIRITERLFQQYAGNPEARCSVRDSDLHDEDCPWCGATGFGSVLCGVCHAEICRGRTDSRGYFRCRASCGASGSIEYDRRTEHGLIPARRAPSPSKVRG